MNEREHVGDNAELYALGLLDAAQRAAVEAHVAGCTDCLRSLGQAEETATALAATLPRVTVSTESTARFARAAGAASSATRRQFPAWFGALALAAALVVALGTAWYANALRRGAPENARLAIATIVRSHFLHVAMTTVPAAGALAAKVLYARDGSWLYVLVDGTRERLDLRATVGGRSVALGTLEPAGDAGSLFVRTSARPTAVELLSKGSLVAKALLLY